MVSRDPVSTNPIAMPYLPFFLTILFWIFAKYFILTKVCCTQFNFCCAQFTGSWPESGAYPWLQSPWWGGPLLHRYHSKHSRVPRILPPCWAPIPNRPTHRDTQCWPRLNCWQFFYAVKAFKMQIINLLCYSDHFILMNNKINIISQTWNYNWEDWPQFTIQSIYESISTFCTCYSSHFN